MNYDKGSMNWNNIQQQILEMRAETEAWAACNEELKRTRESRKVEAAQSSRGDLMYALQWLMAKILALKIYLVSK